MFLHLTGERTDNRCSNRLRTRLSSIKQIFRGVEQHASEYVTWVVVEVFVCLSGGGRRINHDYQEPVRGREL